MTQEEYYKKQKEAKRIHKNHSVGFEEQVEGFCIYCNSKPATDKDHFFPLHGYRRKIDYLNFIKANNKGIVTDDQIQYVKMIFSEHNLVPCCRSCNSSKWSYSPISVTLFGKFNYEVNEYFDDFIKSTSFSAYNRLEKYFGVDDFMNIPLAIKQKANLLK